MMEGWGKTVGITPSARVRFRCQGCGKCCLRVKEGVPVDSLDMFRMAKHLRDKGENILCTDDFLALYAEPVLLDECGYFVYMLKTVGEENACIFLKDNRCTTHDEKPRACRLYPFVVNPDADGNHSFLLSREYPHHFTGPVVQTKSWMKKHFPQEDRRFLQMDFWGAKRIADLLRKIPERNRTQAVLHFHRLKYSEFDLDQPFLEQYRSNQDKLIAILTRMANETI